MQRSEEPDLSWKDCFDEAIDLSINEGETFRVYRTHGKGPIIFLHHGAGLSGLSFALMTRSIKALQKDYLRESIVVAMDCRAHGGSTSVFTELTLDVLSNDAINILNELTANQTPRPDVLLVGHSMGGSVVSKMAEIGKYLGRYIGIVLIDVCGKTALSDFNRTYLRILSRPKSFKTLKDANEWALKTKFPHNLNSANLSIPSLLYEDYTAEEGAKFRWRTDLISTSQFWSDWFDNFSYRFLNLPLPKLVLISDIELLDDQLTKAQIQGKFQLVVVTGSGHLLHEEEPLQTALAIIQFLERLVRNDHILDTVAKRKVLSSFK